MIWQILIFALLAAMEVERGACAVRHTDVSGPSTILQYVALLCLIAYWLEVDSRETKTLRLWDMGFFLYVAWPVIIPYYLVRTRGLKRAVAICLLAAVVCIGAFFAGGAIFRNVP